MTVLTYEPFKREFRSPVKQDYSRARHESAWTIQKGRKLRPLFWTGKDWSEHSALAARFDTQQAATDHKLTRALFDVRISEHWWQVR